MKTQPLKGMRDLQPAEQTLRDHIQAEILATYRAAGFQRISTPILEDLENLYKSDGGDNLNLIFKVLKRGDKLAAALASGDEAKLADMGLRYDLTLPLSRYYAAHRAELPNPFKVIQTDRVYRAERPQKGRLREFVQCDIDILGDSSPNAEVELIDVTARALLRIGFTGFTVNINDRRILLEQGYAIPGAKPRLALLYLPDADFAAVLAKAERLRADYDVTVLAQAKKLGKQFGTLESAGYSAVAFADNDDIRTLGRKQ